MIDPIVAVHVEGGAFNVIWGGGSLYVIGRIVAVHFKCLQLGLWVGVGVIVRVRL